MGEQERQKIEWTDLKVFVDTATEMVVRVQQGLGSGRPQYSVEVGCSRNQKFLKFMRVYYDTSDAGDVSIRPFNREAIDRLLLQAEEHIRAVQQTRESEYQLRQQEREAHRDRTGNKGRRVGTHGRVSDRDERR